MPGGASPVRDSRLAWFASEDGRDTLVPSATLAVAADEVAGPGRRCPGATDDELTGLVRAFAAIESWAAGSRLGVIAEMIRRDEGPRRGDARRGACRMNSDLPDEWSASLRHDLALALACSVQSAGTTAWMAWERHARLPGTGALLDDGTLTLPKARAVMETFRYLSDADAARAESLILGQLAGKTYPQVLKIASGRTQICVTLTSPEGYAIGHGCARLERSSRSSPAATLPEPSPSELPARLNLTVSAAILAGIATSAGPWAFVPRGGTGPPGGPSPPDGFGTWSLTLPDGRRFTVRLDEVPTFECFDHRYETHAYHPSARLRHLVQVRDGTFPSCNRHARESDFEHAIPFEKGGRTCACNGGARSRACHRVKQSPGWRVTQQPKPGWHQWTTPSGRVYVQEPKRYPV